MGGRILVVEDDPHLGRQLTDMLSFLGLEPDWVTTGREGISLFRARPYDVVVCDLMLPGLNGVQTIEEIRALPVGATVPVLLTSAVYTNPRLFERELRRLRITEFVPKPLSVIDVGRKVAAIADGAVVDGGADLTETGSWRLQDLGIALGDSSRAFEPIGKFTRKSLLRVFIEIFGSHMAGELRLTRGRASRTIAFLNGYPVHVESDAPEDSLVAMLVRGGVLAAADGDVLEREAAREGRDIHEALLRASVPERRILQAERDRVRSVVVGTFAWPQGEYSFDADDRFGDSVGIFEVNPVRCLSEAVDRWLGVDEVSADVHALSQSRLVAGARFRTLLPYFTLPRGLEKLPTDLEAEPSLATLFRRFGQSTDALIKALWLMRELDVVRPGPPDSTARLATVPPPPEMALSRSSLPAVPEAPLDARSKDVLAAYLCVMDSDYYALLGIEAESDDGHIRDAVERARGRFDLTLLPDAAPTEVRDKAKELRARVERAAETFANPARRRLYDDMLAVRVTGAGHAVALAVALRDARDFVRTGKVHEALPLLEGLRDAHPHSPLVLSLLGYALWRAQPGDAHARMHARGLIEQSCAIDPSGAEGFRFLAEICEEMGDLGGARRARASLADVMQQQGIIEEDIV